MLIFTTIFLDFLPDQMYYLYFVIPMQLLLSRSKNRDGSDWCQRLDNDLNNSKMTMYLGKFNCGWCLFEYHNDFTWMLHSYKIFHMRIFWVNDLPCIWVEKILNLILPYLRNSCVFNSFVPHKILCMSKYLWRNENKTTKVRTLV